MSDAFAALEPSAIPYAGRTVIALAPTHLEEIRRTIALLFRLAHSPAYAGRVDADAPATARRVPGNFGVFMGYDFHITPDGPRLIEINTNAGGALLNGLHTLSLCDPEKLACLCSDLVPVTTVRERIVHSFSTEMELARGAGARPGRLAIADERPREQFLFPEFELFTELFTAAGIEAVICDTADLVRGRGTLDLYGRPVDLVYLRDTDFSLAEPRSAALREAYLAGDVVLTPTPREHHLLADKGRLAVFSSSGALRDLGVSPADAEFLSRIVPETRLLTDLGPDRAWGERRDWVFKPRAAFGSRAVYRGDKISHRKLEAILTDPAYVAQRRVDPGVVDVETIDGPQRMKFDVRAYAYRDEILLLGARVYQGQVTNLRSPGGGFSAICVSRTPLAPC